MLNINQSLLIAFALKLRQNWRAEAAHLPAAERLAAFTLIELSIVLVIIGLIVGGVLVGQDLIYAAKVRAEFSQIEKLDVAVNTFRLKYNALPGDIKNASTLGLSSGTNGDGDRKIRAVRIISGDTSGINFWLNHTPPSPATNTINEWAMAQQHLYLSDLIPTGKEWADYSDFVNNSPEGELILSKLPRGNSSVSPNVFTTMNDTKKPFLAFGYEYNFNIHGHYFRPGMTTLPGYTQSRTGNVITPIAAKQIDEKFDNGEALTGKILAAPWGGSGCMQDVLGVSATCNSAGGNIGDSSNANRCISSATQNYDTDYDANTCAFRVKASF